MGPEVVLNDIPLGITGNEQSYEFPRSWLLPVLRENVQKTKLSFFKSYFLPIATACHLRAMKAKSEDDKVLQKTYEVIVSQIW
jgi:ribosomal RNA-processing protein 12